MRVIGLLLCVLGSLAGCQSQRIDWEGLEAGQRARDERAREEVPMFMSLETMFPNKRVRALAKAAGDGRVEDVERLAAEGVDVNTGGKSGSTPLFWALRESSFEGYRRLLELGADPNVVFGDSSVLHWAARHIDSAFVKAALEHGGDPDLRAGPLGETPLFETVDLSAEDMRDAMVLLLEYGADINAQTIHAEAIPGLSLGGSTAVMKAAMIGSFPTVYQLLELGADYEIKDDMGNDLAVWVSRKLTRYSPGSPEERDLRKVIDWLTARGVEIPPRE